jgi:hypothetical protein
MLEGWEKLTLFVENPLVFPHSNHAERAHPRTGRREETHYGSRSKRGTEVDARLRLKDGRRPTVCFSACLCQFSKEAEL